MCGVTKQHSRYSVPGKQQHSTTTGGTGIRIHKKTFLFNHEFLVSGCSTTAFMCVLCIAIIKRRALYTSKKAAGIGHFREISRQEKKEYLCDDR